MLALARPVTLVLYSIVVLFLGTACSNSAGGPTVPDARPLLASGSGSDGDGSGGDGGDGDNSGSGSGGGTTPSTGTGQVQIVRGGLGQGTITSQPAGISCAIGFDGPAGACEATFAAGTRVRLEARAASGSEFRGWALTTSCQKAPDVTVVANAVHSCQPVFEVK